MSHTSYEGRHVIVTGGTGALGRAVVARLVEAGAVCHVPVLHEAELAAFPHRDDDRVRLTPGVDLTDEAGVVAFFASAPALWASIHIAGGFSMDRIADTRLADWRHLIDMNATTCFLSAREAVKRIRAASPGTAGAGAAAGGGGRIVNVTARPALVPTGGLAAYAASKAAVAALTLSLAEELADERIWVNAVAPSIIDTPANRAAMPGADHATWPTPAQIAETIVFLASPANAVGRGAIVPVYGRA